MPYLIDLFCKLAGVSFALLALVALESENSEINTLFYSTISIA